MKQSAAAVQPEAVLLDAESLLDSRDLERALPRFYEAEALGAEPDRCAAGRWMADMLLGDFAAAWRESDAIRRRGGPDPHRFWTGEPIDGRRVILRCLHGFGDAVQMLRFVPLLRARCASLTVEVPPRLLPVASFFEAVGQPITWGELAPLAAPAWDLQVEIMELPYLFRTELAQLPLAEHYLAIPESHRASARRALGTRRLPRVGLVWAAGEWNRSRSIPFEYVKEIVQRQGCEFWNLQGGSDAHAWSGLPAHLATQDAPLCREGIAPLAALIEQLDLVITVDTLAAHLAGALGTPAWVLLQQAGDWRWMMDRTDSPWYPSLRLYRQSTEGNWSEVVHRMLFDLDGWLERAGQTERAG